MNTKLVLITYNNHTFSNYYPKCISFFKLLLKKIITKCCLYFRHMQPTLIFFDIFIWLMKKTKSHINTNLFLLTYTKHIF